MITKNGITYKRHEGYACGAGVRIASGDMSLVVLRTSNRKERRFLVSFFAKAANGEIYSQLWIDRENAKRFLKDMKS